MKSSERLKESLKELTVLGTVFLVLGCICVLVTIAILVAGFFGAVPLHILALVIPLGAALIFFSGWAWARFVDYPFDEEILQAVEKEEAREEAHRREQVTGK